MKPTPREFVNALEENEDRMGTGAAMALTCEQFNISEEEGYTLLIESADEDEDEL